MRPNGRKDSACGLALLFACECACAWPAKQTNPKSHWPNGRAAMIAIIMLRCSCRLWPGDDVKNKNSFLLSISLPSWSVLRARSRKATGFCWPEQEAGGQKWERPSDCCTQIGPTWRTSHRPSAEAKSDQSKSADSPPQPARFELNYSSLEFASFWPSLAHASRLAARPVGLARSLGRSFEWSLGRARERESCKAESDVDE